MASCISDDDLDNLFEDATNFVRLNIRGISKDNLLYFYARYKQATDGVCTGERPGGLFNFEGKSKYDAWKALKAMSKEVAMNEYINYLNHLFPEWQTKRGSIAKVGDMGDKGTFGIKLSTMTDTEARLNDSDKSVFDWCKEDNLEHVKQLINGNLELLNQKDENGMTLLMWSCDRGYFDLVKFLLANNANVNEQDTDGQTCVHYAVSCDHLEIIKVLRSQTGIDLSLTDSDGLRAVDMTENAEIIRLLS